MNRVERIKQLEEMLDRALRLAYLNHLQAVDIENDEGGVGAKHAHGIKMDNMKVWLEHAARIDDMIKRLRESPVTPAIPSPPPQRRRELQLDEDNAR